MEALPKYTVYKSKRRSIRLTLRSNGTFAVYCPKGCPKSQIEEIVRKNYEQLLNKFNSRPDPLVSENGELSLPLFGARYPVVFSESKHFCFDGAQFSSPVKDLEKNKSLYKDYLRNVTKECISHLLSEIADANGLSYNGYTVKAMYSRYGSCSGKKHLNFSLALGAFDEEFIRFVVCHELCHTVHMNHGMDFYALLSKLCPEHMSIRKNGARERSEILKAISINRS